MERWTKKQLEEISDLDFAITILNERKNKLTNYYSPLYIKLNRASNMLNEIYVTQSYRGKNIEDYR